VAQDRGSDAGGGQPGDDRGGGGRGAGGRSAADVQRPRLRRDRERQQQRHAAIKAAINAATAAPDGGIVRFTSGNYKSMNTIHLRSHVTLQLDAGATILGSSADTYDAAESNPNDSFQDLGHSHFHDAMIFGNNLTGIGSPAPARSTAPAT
jgi:hypothetical protein